MFDYYKTDQKRNTGEGNSGNENSGHLNSGNRNSGNENSGHWNSGNWNSGNGNSGNRNSGHLNSGNENSGHWNSGHENSGHWNSGDKNSGFFNTITPKKILVFNKECDREKWENADKPEFIFHVSPTRWVPEEQMTDQEKKDNPHVRGGYLKTVSYQQAWREAYEHATKDDIEKLKNLPNFDPEVFKEISGIDVNEQQGDCDGKVVEIEGKKYKLQKVEK